MIEPQEAKKLEAALDRVIALGVGCRSRGVQGRFLSARPLHCLSPAAAASAPRNRQESHPAAALGTARRPVRTLRPPDREPAPGRPGSSLPEIHRSLPAQGERKTAEQGAFAMAVIRCPNCERTFDRYGSGARAYCGEPCRREADMERRRKRRREKREEAAADGRPVEDAFPKCQDCGRGLPVRNKSIAGRPRVRCDDCNRRKNNSRGEKYVALEGHCFLCHSYFPADDTHFSRDKTRSSGWSSRCRKCDAARARARSKKKGRQGTLGTPAQNYPYIPGGVNR